MLLIALALLGTAFLLCVIAVLVGSWRLYRVLSWTRTFSTTGPPASSTPLNLPAGVVIVIGCVLGALAGFVHTFGFASPWAKYVAVIIVLFGALGISPLVGSAFRNAIHIGATASIIITAGLTALAFAIPTLGVSPTLGGILQGVVAFFATVGFGPLPAPPATKYGLGVG